MNRAKDLARIRLFAPFDPVYGSYWIEGPRQVGTIELHPLPAPLPPSSIAFEFGGKNFVIDAWDKDIVNEHWLQWSDVYGKVNLPLDTKINKVVPMGPWTITKAWGIGSMAWTFMQSALWGKGKRRPHRADERGFLVQYKRLPSNRLAPPLQANLHLRPSSTLALCTRGQRAEGPLHEGSEVLGQGDVRGGLLSLRSQ